MRHFAVFKGGGVGKENLHLSKSSYKHTISPANSSQFKCNFIE